MTRISDASRAQYALYRWQMGLPRQRAAKMAGVSNAWAVGFDRELDEDPGELERLLDLHPYGDGQIREPLPYDQLSPLAQSLLVDFEQFRVKVMGRRSQPWAVEAAHLVAEWFDSADREFAVINVAPGSGKSTLFSTDIPAWLTCRSRTIRGVIGSIKAPLSTRYTRRLRMEFERDLPLRAGSEAKDQRGAIDAVATMSQLYGRFKPLKPQVWRADGFIVEAEDSATRTEKEFTWLAASMEEDFIGDRVNMQTWDDAASKASSRSTEVRNRHFEQWEIVEDRLEPGGLLLLVGQRLTLTDIYRHNLDKKITRELEVDGEDTLEERPKYHRIVFRAHYEDLCVGEHAKDAPAYPEGCLLDPSGLPWRDLQSKMANLGEYMLVYQQDDSADPDAKFRRIWIDGGREDETNILYPGCWDTNRDPGELNLDPSQKLEGISYGSVDPSASGFWVVMWFCVAEGQMISTLRGEVPIESVTELDSVWTRAGWRRVRHATRMGVKPVLAIKLSSGRTLRVTADHRVLTTDGWVEAGLLRVGSTLVVGAGVGVGASSASPGPLGVDEQVRPGDLVALGAMGSGAGLGDVWRPEHVDLMGDRLEVGRVAARRVTAKVIELADDRAGVDQHAPGKAVGHGLAELLAAGADCAVPAALAARLAGGHGEASPVPFPAAGGGDGAPIQKVLLVERDGALGPVQPVGAGLTLFSALRLDGLTTGTEVHVVSIIEDGDAQTYDLGVDGMHEFTAEGVIVHNCYDRATGHRILVDMHREKMGANDLLEPVHGSGKYTGVMEDFQQRSIEAGHRIRVWVLEHNSQQRWLSQYDWARRWYASRGVTVVSHQTYAAQKLDDKLGPEGSLPPLLREGLMRLPGSPRGKAKMRPFIDELVHWGNYPTNDTVMAAWMAEYNLPTILKRPTDDWKPPTSWRPSWMKRDAEVRRSAAMARLFGEADD